MRAIAAGLLLLLLPLAAQAHKASDAFLRLKVEGSQVEGRWDIAIRDLSLLLPLDADGDGSVTWGELRRLHSEIASHALSRLEDRKSVV